MVPSPGPNRPAMDGVLSCTFQSALTAMAPGLHFSFSEVA
jgi:hypothetical protein